MYLVYHEKFVSSFSVLNREKYKSSLKTYFKHLINQIFCPPPSMGGGGGGEIPYPQTLGAWRNNSLLPLEK